MRRSLDGRLDRDAGDARAVVRRASRTIDTGSWLGQAFQGRGYGKEMRSAVLSLAFDGLGAQIAETEAFLDNHASAGVSRALGYEENGLGSLAPEGVPRETQRFRMTVDDWRSRAPAAGHDRGAGRLPGAVRGRSAGDGRCLSESGGTGRWLLIAAAVLAIVSVVALSIGS